MSFPRNSVFEIKKWLNAQHIIVSLEWVEACVEFLCQDFHSVSLPLQQLKTNVYKQWLLTDLEEIGVACLPPDLCSIQKMTLTGFYTLQVNGIRDIGKPAYAQLRQLEGTMNADSEVSAAPKAFLPEWESKPTRMLLLNLTDGVNFVQGMEYKPITSLSPNLPPGLKVLITGPVDCRYGMIMLSQEKIKILGGEVETYQQKYSCEAMLKEALQQVATEEEEEGQQTVPDSDFQSRPSNSVNAGPDFTNTFHTNVHPARRNQVDHSLNSNSHGMTRPQVLNYVPQNRNTEVDLDNFDCEDDDFIRDIDYNALDEIERLNSQPVPLPENDVEVNEDEDMLQEAYRFQDDVDDYPQVPYLNNQNVMLLNSNESIQPESNECSKLPFVYLDSVINDLNENCETTITIKGFISKVLSRLHSKPSSGWQLTAKVNDGTASIDADFHDQVLEELVGVSSKEMIKMQIQARENAEIKNQIMKVVNNFKTKLQELNSLMDIQFVPGKKPCVIKCTPVDNCHIEQLLNRVCR